MNIMEVRKKLQRGISIYDMELNVADYDRVSTLKMEQLNSLNNQHNYFSEMISGINNWHHVDSYIDEGISGTQVKKRDRFLQMIEDAKNGKIDLIVTKEISRFARNTVDSIEYTQLLLNYGVAVYFISDNINTINSDSEFRLTLMASMAQDEVRKLSERVKFGIKRSIKDKKLGGSTLTGYIKKDGKLKRNEEQVPIVETIFSLYATGNYNLSQISKELARRGYFTKKGKTFSNATLKKIITNPRYKGVFTANLSEVIDYRTHKKINNPKKDWVMFEVDNNIIEPIISKRLWNKANKIYNERINKNCERPPLENNLYTSKLICSEHNVPFIRCNSGKRKNKPIWQCNEYLRHGLKSCKSPIIPEEKLNEIFIEKIELYQNYFKKLIKYLLENYKKIICDKNIAINNIEISIKEKINQKDNLLDIYLKRIIDNEEYISKRNKLKQEIKDLKDKYNFIFSQKNTKYNKSILSKVNKYLNKIFDIRINNHELFNLFIEKVYISKIDNDRKKIKLLIDYKFKIDKEIINIILI